MIDLVTYTTSSEEAIQHNLRRLKKLSPIKVAKEWCEIEKKVAGKNWKLRKPEDWF
jgi:hypothetical protein